MGRLDNKVAIVTGGASNPGLGHATAHRFAEEGAKVVVTDIDMKNGEKTVSEILEKKGEAIFIEHDVTSPKDWEKVVSTTVEKYGKIDILVNNAGIAIIKPFEEISEEDWDKQLNVNLKSVFLGCKSVISHMREAHSGSLINVSSIAGQVGLSNCTAYSASKGGVRLLTKTLAVEYGPHNVRCNSIHPGYMRTNMNDPDVVARRDRNSNDLTISIPLGRMGEALDIADCAVYLASDESNYVTGSEFNVDAGYTAR